MSMGYSYQPTNYITFQDRVLYSTKKTEAAIRFGIRRVKEDPYLILYLWRDGTQFFRIRFNPTLRAVTLSRIEHPEKRSFSTKGSTTKPKSKSHPPKTYQEIQEYCLRQAVFSNPNLNPNSLIQN